MNNLVPSAAYLARRVARYRALRHRLNGYWRQASQSFAGFISTINVTQIRTSDNPKSIGLLRRGATEPMTRVGDFLIACILLAVSLPLMIVVALAIKWESRGPILERPTFSCATISKPDGKRSYRQPYYGERYRRSPARGQPMPNAAQSTGQI